MTSWEFCSKVLFRWLGGWAMVCGLSVSAAYAQSDSSGTANISPAPVVKKIQPSALYKQAMRDERDNKWSKAIAAYEKLLRQVGDYEDAAARLEQARAKLQQRERLEIEYAGAQTAFNNRRWTYALIAFERILEAEPNFRDARQKLALAQKNLKRESVENIVAQYHADATMSMSRNDLGMAYAAWQKVQALDSTDQEAAGQLLKIEAMLRPPSEPAIAVAAPAAVDSQALAPTPENTGKTEFAAASAARYESSQTFYYAGGIFAVLVLLSTIGWVSTSPLPRAKFHLWRGNYLAAAKVYEKTLEHHPHQVKLLLPLADIYLRLRKNDAPAMRVYKTILQLNLTTRRREAINAIVAQKYLSDGRTDEDAISVLEEALKAEQYKTTQNSKRAVKELTA